MNKIDKRARVQADFRDPAQVLAFGFGAGLSPVAPGTVGTLAAVPLYLLCAPLPLAGYLLVLVLLTAAGTWAAGVTCRRLGVHDHGGIVIDEFAGFLLTMVAISPTPAGLVAGFLLFRLFDVLKPWPIRVLDRRVHGGFGVMLDDLVAGLFAAAVLWGLALWQPGWFGPATIGAPW